MVAFEYFELNLLITKRKKQTANIKGKASYYKKSNPPYNNDLKHKVNNRIALLLLFRMI